MEKNLMDVRWCDYGGCNDSQIWKERYLSGYFIRCYFDRRTTLKSNYLRAREIFFIDGQNAA